MHKEILEEHTRVNKSGYLWGAGGRKALDESEVRVFNKNINVF